MSDAWAPVHHEEMDTDEPAAHARSKTNGAARPRDNNQQVTMPIAMSMAMTVPPELIAAVNDLTETQEALGKEFVKLGERMDKLIERVLIALEEGKDATAKAVRSMPTHDGVIAQVKAAATAQSLAHKELVGSIAGLNAAITAPRHVMLERDKAGAAIGAVSTVGKPH